MSPAPLKNDKLPPSPVRRLKKGLILSEIPRGGWLCAKTELPGLLSIEFSCFQQQRPLILERTHFHSFIIAVLPNGYRTKCTIQQTNKYMQWHLNNGRKGDYTAIIAWSFCLTKHSYRWAPLNVCRAQHLSYCVLFISSLKSSSLLLLLFFHSSLSICNSSLYTPFSYATRMHALKNTLRAYLYDNKSWFSWHFFLCCAVLCVCVCSLVDIIQPRQRQTNCCELYSTLASVPRPIKPLGLQCICLDKFQIGHSNVWWAINLEILIWFIACAFAFI